MSRDRAGSSDSPVLTASSGASAAGGLPGRTGAAAAAAAAGLSTSGDAAAGDGEWNVLLQGYLLKTKYFKTRTSTKLRWCVLRKHTATNKAFMDCELDGTGCNRCNTGPIDWCVCLSHASPAPNHDPDYHDASMKTLKGTIDLQGSRTVPLPGSAKFEVHTADRVYFLQAENHDIALAHIWVLQLQVLAAAALASTAGI